MEKVVTKYTVAIGDIHGKYDALMELICEVEHRYDSKGDIQWITLGDYVDRGENSAKVVEFLRANENWIKIKGNHDDMMARWDNAWIPNGGGQTLDSYGFKNFYWKPDGAYLPIEKQLIPMARLARDQKWLATLPTSYEDEHRIYVHAGLYPGENWRNSSDYVKMWIRNEFLLTPHSYDGKLVVHGHSPYHSKDGNIQQMPWRVNADTASCFGGHLTALVFHEDFREHIDAVQIPTPRRITAEEIEKENG
jgi:serine/threonine protein phosphatase 1